MYLIMKHLSLFSLLVCYSVIVFAQKLPIDSSVFEKWPSVGNPQISNDGNYVLYTINNLPENSSSLVIKATNNSWEKEITSSASYNAKITEDSRLAIFVKSIDSLGLITLETGQVDWIPNTRTYKMPSAGKDEWLAYQLKNSSKDLVLRNLFTENELRFSMVTDYLFNNNGNVLLLLIELSNDSCIKHALQWINLTTGKVVIIWTGENAGNFAFDVSGNQLAFIAEKMDTQIVNTLWYYKAGMETALTMVNNGRPEIENDLVLANGNPQFSKDGNCIFFSLQQKKVSNPKSNVAHVDVWSYTDAKLQSLQLEELTHPRYYHAVINTHENRVIQLEHEDEILEIDAVSKYNSDFVLVNHRRGHYREANWNFNAQPSFFLVSTKNGSIKLLNRMENLSISHSGRYVIYYDNKLKNYFSYDIATSIIRNITKEIPVSLTYEDYDNPGSSPPVGIGTWLEQDTAVLIYDNYDIWQVDPSGVKSSVSITNGYGRKHQIVFRLANYSLADSAVPRQSQLLLTAINKANKYNGFYRAWLGIKGNPELLTMGPYIYHSPWASPFPPLKAKNADLYLVRRMSATEAPNYYLTLDFKTYSPLTCIQPQKKYNWLTAELIRWKTFNGSSSAGILYKPENFNPKKKYPIIFNFYEKLSDKLYCYFEPAQNSSNINIPWFVSNGYLVFTPDIHYVIGEPGESAYNSIVSVAKYLSKMPWVDSTKMGIQGHSFGGYEVNYLVTRTNLFAAAASGAGLTNYVSGYGGLWSGGISRQYIYETRQCRIGATLWQRPDLYIKNSPILRTAKVTTPLLIMHNKDDKQVPWADGVEFFTGLRRLGKKVWMLQYDNEGHGVNGKAQEDYHIRLSQFFDHYLKGTPAPKWMTQGLPASRKGIDTGFELDYFGKKP